MVNQSIIIKKLEALITLITDVQPPIVASSHFGPHPGKQYSVGNLRQGKSIAKSSSKCR